MIHIIHRTIATTVVKQAVGTVAVYKVMEDVILITLMTILIEIVTPMTLVIQMYTNGTMHTMIGTHQDLIILERAASGIGMRQILWSNMEILCTIPLISIAIPILELKALCSGITATTDGTRLTTRCLEILAQNNVKEHRQQIMTMKIVLFMMGQKVLGIVNILLKIMCFGPAETLPTIGRT